MREQTSNFSTSPVRIIIENHLRKNTESVSMFENILGSSSRVKTKMISYKGDTRIDILTYGCNYCELRACLRIAIVNLVLITEHG